MRHSLRPPRRRYGLTGSADVGRGKENRHGAADRLLLEEEKATRRRRPSGLLRKDQGSAGERRVFVPAAEVVDLPQFLAWAWSRHPERWRSMAMRRFLSAVFVTGVAAALAMAVPAAASAAPIQLTLPVPTGPDQSGTVSLHLVQNGRPDPWVPSRTRELMVSLWYPARHVDAYPTAPYMEAGAWASLERI